MSATDAARQKILIVTRNLPPLVGGMERLNWHMADELAHRAEVRMIGPAGSAARAPNGVHVIEIPLRPLWKFFAFSFWHAVREARRWRPDIVLAGSGLTTLPVWLAARAASARAAVYVHGLDVAVRHPLYRMLWLPALRRMDRVIANSGSTADLTRNIGVSAARIGIVHPGVELPDKSCDPQAVARFRAEHGLGDRPLLLSVGRLSARKGLREFVSEAMPRIIATQPDALLLIVGGVPMDALHAEAQTPDSIRMAAARIGLPPESLRFLGTITDKAKLSAAYRAANVHVFPVREIPGDPEGFGMVAVEAAAHGLPTVAFATGGVVEAVAEGYSGHLVTSDDYAHFAAAVGDVLKRRADMSLTSAVFGARFLWPLFGHALCDELGLHAESRRPRE